MSMPSKEWAKLFLENWDRAVELWDNGKLFEPGLNITVSGVPFYEGYNADQQRNQTRYADICVTWLIPNGMVEPHCVAEGG